MIRKAYKMKLMPGFEKEYEKRHSKIWPDVKQMIKENGISDYSIYWDRETNYLFSSMKVDEAKQDSAMKVNAVRDKWWAFMKDIMETNEDNSPISTELLEVFHID